MKKIEEVPKKYLEKYLDLNVFGYRSGPVENSICYTVFLYFGLLFTCEMEYTSIAYDLFFYLWCLS